MVDFGLQKWPTQPTSAPKLVTMEEFLKYLRVSKHLETGKNIKVWLRKFSWGGNDCLKERDFMGTGQRYGRKMSFNRHKYDKIGKKSGQVGQIPNRGVSNYCDSG